jgi:hypothetical protein
LAEREITVLKRKPKDTSHPHDSMQKGSGGAMADGAVEANPKQAHHHPGTPHSRPAKPLKRHEKHDQMADKEAASEDRQEALLDEAIEESFPGSDPISPSKVD